MQKTIRRGLAALAIMLVSLLCIAVPANAAGTIYHYATGKQTHNVTQVEGFASYMQVNNPQLDNAAGKDSHSLAEIAVVNTSSGHKIEVGWTKDLPVCGQSTDPCLFVYWGNAGVGQCYNTNCAGYVDIAGGVNAGDAIGGTPVSRYFVITHSVNAWYIQYNGANIGYFPDNIFTGGFTSANETYAFGEIASQFNGAAKSCSDMGSGVLATATAGATISTGSYDPVGATSWTASSYTLSTSTTSGFAIPAGAWAAVFYSGSTRSFHYGGPMWNSAGTGAGTTGSC